MAKLQLVQDPAADALLESKSFALLVGMLLDQQIPIEQAFAGQTVEAVRPIRDEIEQRVRRLLSDLGVTAHGKPHH